MEKKQMNKKGNTAMLTAIGWGLVTFAILIGLGMVVLTKMGDAVVQCPATIGGVDAFWNATRQLCSNGSAVLGTTTGGGSGWTTIDYVSSTLGSTGLSGWIPVVIVVLIAGLILAMFGGRGKNY